MKLYQINLKIKMEDYEGQLKLMEPGFFMLLCKEFYT